MTTKVVKLPARRELSPLESVFMSRENHVCDFVQAVDLLSTAWMRERTAQQMKTTVAYCS